jgi:SNF2 family DNA or RNA helicase
MRGQQQSITAHMLASPAKLIVSGMGSGKTGAALTAIRTLLDRMIIRRVLIIAPRRVAQNTWPDEIAAWEHTLALRYTVVAGDEDDRLVALARDVEITIIARDNLVWLAKHYFGSVERWPYDCVVIDESSMFKAGKARTKATKVKAKDGTVRLREGGKITRFGVLSAARKKIDRIYLLTGTPAPNGVQDLWAQIYLLDQGKRLGPARTAFEKKWFHLDARFKPAALKDGAREAIMSRITDIMVAMPKIQIVPDPIYIPVYVDLPPAAMAEYKRFRRTMVSQEYDVEALNAGVLTGKLLQYANGSMYREDGTVVPVHDEKLSALDELVEQADGDNVLVLYSFKFDLDVIRKRFPHAVVLNESESAVRDWNAGKIRMLLAHPASCAHGLNMQYGGHIAIWYGLTWSLELWQQANARLPRDGQIAQVLSYQIIARNTDDERVLEVLADRDATQEMVTSAVLHRDCEGE